MIFKQPKAQVYVPDGTDIETALARTTHLGIGAHQDDLELMSIPGILDCFQQKVRWFTGVVVTNGSGSPRAGLYADFSDDEMQALRAIEQKKAAMIGEYAAKLQSSHLDARLRPVVKEWFGKKPQPCGSLFFVAKVWAGFWKWARAGRTKG